MTPTEKQFCAALAAHTAEHGAKATFLILKKVAGTTAASQVKPERYATVISAINADARFTNIHKSPRIFLKPSAQHPSKQQSGGGDRAATLGDSPTVIELNRTIARAGQQKARPHSWRFGSRACL